MVSLIARWYVREGQQAAAVAAVRALAEEVRAAEPDTLMYLVHVPDMAESSLPPPTDTEVFFVEAYASMDAFYAHLNGPAFTNFVKRYGRLFQYATGTTAEGAAASIPFVQNQWLDRQAGFVRPQAAGAAPVARAKPSSPKKAGRPSGSK